MTTVTLPKVTSAISHSDRGSDSRREELKKTWRHLEVSPKSLLKVSPKSLLEVSPKWLREVPPKWHISSRRESLPRSKCDIAEVTSGSVAVVTSASHSEVTLHMLVEDTWKSLSQSENLR